MRFTFFFALVMFTSAHYGTCFTDVKQSSENDKISAASNIKNVHTYNRILRLRGGYEERSEGAADLGLPVMSSTGILHAVEENKPLPKWAKLFLVLLGVGTISGLFAMAST
ncbi:RxLR effector protein [Phytophthora megakarya]|uniref:RxLR effector protein n=1 Tax=Phytophthora megakarya TaxID=4795 RepID=A0A225URU4_9STRA|nr:RxLR effector protein [Phytophthora megakarya]